MTHFEKYKKLIQKEAWINAKKWNVDYEEMEAEGFMIYCEALKTWNPKKGNFATHLYFSLMNLNTFGKEQYKQEHIKNEIKINPIIQPRYDFGWLDELKKELSDPAYQLLLWILSYEWWGKLQRKRKLPTLPQSMKHFNLTKFKMKIYWDELKEVWRKKEQDFSEIL